DVHSGGSGCGCCGSVLCGHILRKVADKKLNNILVMATGALLSPTSVQQKQSIPCIAHLVNIVS
ncbi:MAG: stage V sporulation protein AD, partial [Ruminococcus sp.]|nr:stage V sporulation protein AD [Ruminococcus sp.]